MSKSPIFIHSLFRSGSTYLFNVFRRSSTGYWCYQESLHEMAVFSRDEPEQLLNGFGEHEMRLNRHPLLDTPYFQELHDTWPAWKDVLSASAVYDGYFAPRNKDIGIPYWRSLARAAKGRPVFQECRTAGRIEAIKDQLGGYHIYLWRNPWDQWWSYKVTPYFDVANQLIINAPNSPPAVQVLRSALGLEACGQDDLGGAYAYYSAKPLTSEESYLVFYLLWCLGLQAGVKYADMMLNIDRLSDAPAYRREIQAQLLEAGIDGVDFSDCQVSQGVYLEQDQAFFTALEDKVHYWLKEGGWSQNELDHIHDQRQQYQPASWSEPIAALSPQDMVEQACRARALARRLETNMAGNVRGDAAMLTAANMRATEAETRAAQVEALANQAESRAQQAEALAQQSEARAQQSEARGEQSEARAQQSEARAQQSEARAQQSEARAQQSESRAQQSEALAQQSEARAQQSEARAEQAEAKAHHTESTLNAVYHSRSWRITRPLRSLFNLLRSARQWPKKVLKIFLKPLLLIAIHVVRSNSWFNKKAVDWVRKYPRLDARLRHFAAAKGIMGSPEVFPYVSNSEQHPSSISVEYSQLTARGRKVYDDLIHAIERRQGRHI